MLWQETSRTGLGMMVGQSVSTLEDKFSISDSAQSKAIEIQQKLWEH